MHPKNAQLAAIKSRGTSFNLKKLKSISIQSIDSSDIDFNDMQFNTNMNMNRKDSTTSS